MNNLKDNRGYVALMSVIIVTAVGLLVAVSLLTLGTLRGRTSFVLEQKYRASALSYTCANKALENIRLDADYGGNEEIDFGNGSCEVLPVVQETGVYTIHTRGFVGDVVRKSLVVATRTEDPDPEDPETSIVTLTVDSWREVAN